MNNNRIWMVGTAILSVAIIALGWFLGISPKFGEAAVADSQTAEVTAVNDGYSVDLAELIKQYESLDDVKGELLAVRKSMPDNAAYAEFIRQLGATSTATGVSIIAFNHEEAAPWTVEGALPIEGGPDLASTVVKEGSLVVLPVTIGAMGSKAALYAFIEAMRTGQRLFLTTDIDIIGVPESSALNLGGHIYAYNDLAESFEPTVVDPGAIVTAPVVTPEPEETPLPTDTATPTPTPTP